MQNNNSTDFIGKFILVWLAALYIGVSIFFNTFTQNIVLNKPLSVSMIALLLFFVWLGHSIHKNGSFKLPASPISLPIIFCIVVCCVISTFRTLYFWYYNLEETSRFLSYFMIIFLLVAYCKTITHIEYFLIIILLVTLLTSLYGILQIYNIDFIEWGMATAPYVSTFGNQNFFAGYLAVAAPICFALIITAKTPLYRITAIITFILAGFNIIYSGNRSAIIAFAAEIVIFTILSIRFGILNFCLKHKGIFFGTIITVFFVFTGIGYLSMKASPYFSIRVKTIFQTHEGTNLVRKIMWTGAGRMFRDEPIMGQGMGTFQLTFPKYRPSNYHRSGVSHNTMHAHNEFMEWFAENGLMGITAFWWIIIAYFILVMHMLLTVKSKYLRNIQIGLLTSVLGFIIENLMSVNYRWTAPATNSWFIMGLSVALCYALKSTVPSISKISLKKSESKNEHNPLKYLVYIVLTIVFFNYVRFCFTLTKSDFYLKMGMVRVDNNPNAPNALDEAEIYLSRSILLYPYDLSSYYKLGFVYLQKGSTNLREGKNAEGINNLYKALEMYGQIIKIAPNYAQIHNNIAMLHLQLGNNYEAMRQFEWATILENNERNHENLVHHYMQRFKNTGQAFYHAFMLKEIAREEKERAARKLQSYYYFYDDMTQFENQKTFFNQMLTEFNTQQSRYVNTIKDISTIRAEKGDLKSAVNWITLAIDLEPLDVKNKLIMMQYMIRSGDIKYVKRYFDFLEKQYVSTSIKTPLFTELPQLLNSMIPVLSKNEEKAQLFALMAKSFKITGNEPNSKIMADEARRVAPNNKEVNDYLKNL